MIVLAILLLSTQACHLCELAQGVLQQAFSQPDVLALSQQAELQIYLQDIIDQPIWLEQYGEKIPVLLDESSNLTLEWPFDVSAAVAWLEKVAVNTGSSTV
ncbi:Glutaredoxin 2 [Oleispira antarctica RB-8]|uniref:Glutaredoxin 2 n=1 Tax=Oleispira antarctica RB-8 TaxID=698738 RepID=R4YN03_OLEAN|nr:Glutaredoxin 2 [Oleispira antarctica RB-8]